MSEADRPKRRWFRFHLLTAVLMMLTAGVLLWANMSERGLAHGWPFTMHYQFIALDSEEAAEMAAQNIPPWSEWDGSWIVRGVILNCIVALTGLTAIAFVSESLIHRREARKQ